MWRTVGAVIKVSFLFLLIIGSGIGGYWLVGRVLEIRPSRVLRLPRVHLGIPSDIPLGDQPGTLFRAVALDRGGRFLLVQTPYVDREFMTWQVFEFATGKLVSRHQVHHGSSQPYWTRDLDQLNRSVDEHGQLVYLVKKECDERQYHQLWRWDFLTGNQTLIQAWPKSSCKKLLSRDGRVLVEIDPVPADVFLKFAPMNSFGQVAACLACGQMDDLRIGVGLIQTRRISDLRIVQRFSLPLNCHSEHLTVSEDGEHLIYCPELDQSNTTLHLPSRQIIPLNTVAPRDNERRSIHFEFDQQKGHHIHHIWNIDASGHRQLVASPNFFFAQHYQLITHSPQVVLYELRARCPNWLINIIVMFKGGSARMGFFRQTLVVFDYEKSRTLLSVPLKSSEWSARRSPKRYHVDCGGHHLVVHIPEAEVDELWIYDLPLGSFSPWWALGTGVVSGVVMLLVIRFLRWRRGMRGVVR